jgi:flagellar assembly protein FliH
MILKSEGSGGHLFPEMPVDMATSERPNVWLLEFLSVEAAAEQPVTKASEDVERVAASDDDRREHERSAQMRAMVDAARTDARTEMRRELERETEARVAAERARVGAVCGDFVRDRSRYFADAEEQVVKLALAIAARVLHREAMMDPLLLAGAVRVAIAKVEESSAVSLRVASGELEKWQREFPAASEPAIEVLADERLATGEVVLETVVGRVELGVAVQLEEIEQGFFDLLQRRPN